MAPFHTTLKVILPAILLLHHPLQISGKVLEMRSNVATITSWRVLVYFQRPGKKRKTIDLVGPW